MFPETGSMSSPTKYLASISNPLSIGSKHPSYTEETMEIGAG